MAFMELHDGVNNSLDAFKTMKSEISEVPDWVKYCAVQTTVQGIQGAPENLKPFLDIYSEIISLHARLDKIQYTLAIQTQILNELSRPPWIRFWHWLSSLF